MARSTALSTALLLGMLCAARAAAPYTPLFDCPLDGSVKAPAPGAPLVAGGVGCRAPDGDATKAAAFAVAQMDAQSTTDSGPLKLVAVLNYASQVVAGANRFVTFVYADSKGVMRIAQAEVFYGLDGKQALTKAQPVPPLALAAGAANKAAAAPLFACSAPGLAGGVACKAGGPDGDARKAAAFALAAINAAGALATGPAALAAVTKPYATQVVAGTNYFVSFVAYTPNGAASVLQAQVYQDLQRKQALTAWSAMQPAAPAASAAKPAPRAAAKPAAAAAKPLFSCPTQPMPGGLACKPANADATAAAKFAVGAVNAAKSAPGTPLTLSKVNTYATQVVAGTNYFVDFDVKDAAGATRRMQAKVFRALPVYGGKMELTASVMLP